jgi:Ca2+-transporting ATPase
LECLALVTVNITAVVLTFVSAVTSDHDESILTPVQLLWVNFIMDTFAAMALATDPPTPSVLDRKPEPKTAPLVTLTIWKMIIAQALYQLAVTLALNLAGNQILGYTGVKQESLETSHSFYGLRLTTCAVTVVSITASISLKGS